MNSNLVLQRLRIFLFSFSIFIFAGSLAELFFLNHFREKLQFAPFFLSVLGIILSALTLIKPTVGVLKAMRIGMWVIVGGGIFGMTIHVIGNFEMLQQATSLVQVLKTGLGGRNPFLAPGILSMAAALSLAAGYQYLVKPK